ncbi:uncharacterized protein [Antedon mediterranea]|uniref:uncharacterized protein n=1 Tax=Antedon mediterranea TaxID=105859 RepID=UPI003AF7F66D
MAYGAVGYIHGERDGKVETAFVAKSKVAPKKQLNVPRLELCAVLVGARLMDFIEQTLKIPISTSHLWSDSTTVLTWLASETCRFKVFVGTRVTEINHKDMTWHYVPTKQNVANDIMRGSRRRPQVEIRTVLSNSGYRPLVSDAQTPRSTW